MFVVGEITPAITDTFEHPALADGVEKLQAYQEIANQPFAHYSALFELGKLYLEAGDVAEAAPYLMMSLNMNPCDPDYHRQYAEAMRRAGDDDIAQVHENQAQMLEDAGVDKTIYVAADKPATETPLPTADENLSVDQLFGLTAQMFNAKRLVDSDRYCRALLKAQPNHLDGNNASAMIAQQAGRHDLAVEKFCRAIEMIDKSKAPLFQGLSTSLKYMGRYQEAETIRQSAGGMFPEPESEPFRRTD